MKGIPPVHLLSSSISIFRSHCIPKTSLISQISTTSFIHFVSKYLLLLLLLSLLLFKEEGKQKKTFIELHQMKCVRVVCARTEPEWDSLLKRFPVIVTVLCIGRYNIHTEVDNYNDGMMMSGSHKF